MLDKNLIRVFYNLIISPQLILSIRITYHFTVISFDLTALDSFFLLYAFTFIIRIKTYRKRASKHAERNKKIRVKDEIPKFSYF